MGDLFNVHRAISEAQFERKANEQEMVTISCRLPQSVKESTQEICERSGITMSEFLRKCCEGLVEDYVHPRVAEKF